MVWFICITASHSEELEKSAPVGRSTPRRRIRTRKVRTGRKIDPSQADPYSKSPHRSENRPVAGGSVLEKSAPVGN